MSISEGDISAAVDRATASVTSGSSDTPAAPASDTPAGGSGQPAAAPASGAPADATAGQSGSDRPPVSPRKARASHDTGSRPTGTLESPAGSPPEDRWPTILENARTETRTKLLEEYGLDDRVGTEVVRTVAQMFREFPDIDPQALVAHAALLRNNPRAYYERLGEQLRRAGVLDAGSPDGGRPPAAPKRERPQPTFRAEDGTPFYDGPAVDQLLDWMRAELLDEVEQRNRPLVEVAESYRHAEMNHLASQAAQEQMADMKTWPHFEEFRAEIGKMMLADGRVTPESAYNRLLRARLADRDKEIREETRAATLAELKKAPDPNTMRPGKPAPAPARPRRGRTLDDAIDRAVEHAVGQVSS